MLFVRICGCGYFFIFFYISEWNAVSVCTEGYTTGVLLLLLLLFF